MIMALAADEAKSDLSAKLQPEILPITGSNGGTVCKSYAACLADIKAGKKIQCPLLTLWAATGAMGKLYDVLGIWKDEGVNVSGKGLPGNHSLQESAPKETLAEIQQFLRA